MDDPTQNPEFSEDPTIAPDSHDPSGGPSSAHNLPTVDSNSSSDLSEAETLFESIQGIAAPRAADEFTSSVPGFTIIRVLGQGGMGAVYLAEQDKPRRTVALKVIRSDRVSAATLKRFDYEAELLASLRHPGIAAVYEVGNFEFDGATVPYFAMEYIAGARSLTAYANEHEVGIRDRLSLFMKVCEAVHHGHQRGVIHRDLKPANILVDEQGETRIIDFGVARGSDEHRASQTMQTDAGQIVGTLQYMSPEQCNGSGVDVRSDVYALGAVLYQLLAGRLPYDIREMNLAEAITTVTKTPVEPISTFVPATNGDLSVIVGKSLEKNQTDRYQSVSQLAEDIRRFLSDEPILAKPTSPFGLLRKWMKRNRELSVALSTAAALLIITTTVLAARIIAAERKAVQNLRLAETNLIAAEEGIELVGQMLKFESPNGESRIRSGMVDIEVLLDDAVASIEASPPELPGTEAAFRELMGVGYIALRSTEKAKSQLQRVLEVRRETGPSPELAEAMHELARAHYWAGEYDQALPLYSEALELRRSIYKGDHAETAYSLTHLAATRLRLGDKESAKELYEEALAMRRRIYGAEHTQIAASLNNVGNMRLALGDLEQAERSLRESLQMISRLKAGNSIEVSNASNNLARVLLRRGNHAEAIGLYRKALDIRETRLKPTDGRVWASRLGLAASLQAEMDGSGSIDGLEKLEVAIEGTPSQRGGALLEIAARLLIAERSRDAAAMIDGVLLIENEVPGSTPLASALVMRAACAVSLGSLSDAESFLARARPIIKDQEQKFEYHSVLDDLITALQEAGHDRDASRCAVLALE